jgi:hypothetical protein
VNTYNNPSSNLPEKFRPNLDSDQPQLSNLMGNLVSHCEILRDVEEISGYFFNFPDLCLRYPGEYTLRFVINDMAM